MWPSLTTRMRSARVIASSTSWVTSKRGRLVALAQLQQQAVHPQPRERVERAEGLVEQQQPRLADEGPSQRHALGLAAGQRSRPGVGACGDPDLLERADRVGLDRLRAEARSGRCARRASTAAGGGPGTRPRGSRGTLTWPSAPGSSPASARSSVLLPEPLAPSRAVSSPSCRSRSMPESTVRPWKRAAVAADPDDDLALRTGVCSTACSAVSGAAALGYRFT